MSAQDLIQLLRTRPFMPFRLYSSDGRTYDVRHPDQALVLLSRVILPMSADKAIPDRSEHLALAHIVRAEEMPSEASQSASDGENN